MDLKSDIKIGETIYFLTLHKGHLTEKVGKVNRFIGENISIEVSWGGQTRSITYYSVDRDMCFQYRQHALTYATDLLSQKKCISVTYLSGAASSDLPSNSFSPYKKAEVKADDAVGSKMEDYATEEMAKWVKPVTDKVSRSPIYATVTFAVPMTMGKADTISEALYLLVKDLPLSATSVIARGINKYGDKGGFDYEVRGSTHENQITTIHALKTPDMKDQLISVTPEEEEVPLITAKEEVNAPNKTRRKVKA
jgi:hypothetical protein|tara:strand:+ start:6313 stop:7068 length:756 start_codon:yes stop_codon:yes gene_type:complete